MTGGPHTKLNSLTNAQDATISNILLDNFINFYDWGFVDRGSFYNISIPQSGLYGGDRHKLRKSDDPRYTSGKVWEGYRKNWVWESGIDGTTQQPITISGVFVDGDFYATGNTTKPFYVDYPNGRVIFDDAQSSSANVQLEYSHKWVDVVPAEGISWFRQIQSRSFRNESGFHVENSGGWAVLGQSRVQLPALAVEVIPPRSLEGYQLGGGQNVNNDIVFYVITENHWECANIMDSVLYQNDRNIHLYDPTKVGMSGASPFNYRNELRTHAIPSGLYPNLVDNFHWRKCWINNSRSNDITQMTPDLYIGSVRCSTEVKAI